MTAHTGSRLIIVGAAGRDFHDFNVYWRHRPDVEVVCFTATQIPGIDGRRYPSELAGDRYPDGIPIHAEADLEKLIADLDVDLAAMAYSDMPHEAVMHLAARANASGASFVLLGAAQTMLASRLPVVAVVAVRTGCGKSQVSRRVSGILQALGKRVAVVRHPMPYGDLRKQACQRFATLDDLERHDCTIEEREEYEPHITRGSVLFAGVDYETILRRAEEEADVVLWDGGNNDTPFFRPDLTIVVTDPHRAGHELRYYPGETNLRMADVVIVNKVATADEDAIRTVESNVRSVNPTARIIRANSPISIEGDETIAGKRVLVIEDGPTLTHGDMTYGAGFLAARRAGAAEIIDPRPFAVGSIKAVYEKYGHLSAILPAMGYGRAQMDELEATINASDCDLVVVGTPIDLGRILTIDKPTVRVRYDLDEVEPEVLEDAVAAAVEGRGERVPVSDARV